VLDLKKQYKLKPDIVLKGLNNKYWALSTSSGNQYKLNEIAYTILNEMIETRSVEELADQITKDYKVSKQVFQDDCNMMIADALKNGLIEEVN